MGPVTSVQALTTGTGSQHEEHRYGSWMPKTMWALLSRSWVELPILVFVIQHEEGLVLFDTGVDPRIATDPRYIDSAVGRFFLHRLFRMNVGPEDRLDRKLAGLGLLASDVRAAVFSHLHFDHVGGIEQIPQAELHVCRREWDQLSTPHPERDFILPETIERPGARWTVFDFAPTDDPSLSMFGSVYDLFDDGSLVMVPTPGHTPGSLSLLIRSEPLPPMLLVGDLTYDVDLLLRDQVPGTGHRDQLRRSFARVRALRSERPDLLILPSHDFRAQDALRDVAARPS